MAVWFAATSDLGKRTVLLAAILTAPLVSAEPNRPEAQRVLRWCDPHGLFDRGWKRVGGQARGSVRPHGRRALLGEGRARCGAAGRFRTRDQVVLVRSESSEWNLSLRAMGAVLSRRGPRSEVYVFFNDLGVRDVDLDRGHVLDPVWMIRRVEEPS